MEKSTCANSLSRHIIKESGFYAPVMKTKHKLALKAHEEYMQRRNAESQQNALRSKSADVKGNKNSQKKYQISKSQSTANAKQQNFRSSPHYPEYFMKQPEPALSNGSFKPKSSKQINCVWYPPAYPISHQYGIPYPLAYY
ncbi:uncharacterized protein SOCG_00234 [Schizosaccharomyces octosporus yFS286]|uniref:Uncharacterized protein n=1 Tax=Schizosaccharomyces octosporus (strain yFS286) TaxID=483514 RepID=S9PTK7_SCHOY|nr:uncharacterized protein SOCG_00234 [Schizosaccharomyces octosporus yFS286]EPX72471.1 hypothetical protein SOCG_00234 [Schizosaccharomyces octosporus yFS286]